MKRTIGKGFTLIEIVVSVGLFAIVMTLSTGAYLMMISANQYAQSIASGINNLSFALETMTRTIRTGTNYNGGLDGCSSGCTSFIVTNTSDIDVTYTASAGGVITQNDVALTDSSVRVSSLMFYVTGAPSGAANGKQPYVTIVVSGSVIPKAGKDPIPFNMETSAVMRGTDL